MRAKPRQRVRLALILSLVLAGASGACTGGAGPGSSSGAATAAPGTAPATRTYGSDAGQLPTGTTAIGLAADPATGGYWILRSDGHVDGFHAPLGHGPRAIPPGTHAIAIAAGRDGGYLLLSSDGGVHGWGTPYYGSDAGQLPAGVTAVGLATDQVTGGYWILRSDGGVDGFHAPVSGSLAGQIPYGTTVKAIAAGPHGGYQILLAAGGPVPADLRGSYFNRIPTTRKVVALTFDIGPVNGIPSTLATLRKYRVRATFFLVGGETLYNQVPMRAIAAAGELVGNHSNTHPHFPRISDRQVGLQLLGAQARIQALTGVSPWPWFRFPYGDHNARTVADANAAGYVPIGWTVDSLGWMGTKGGITVASIVSRVMANLQPGEIVLMHGGTDVADGSHLDADALPVLIPKLEALGYSFVTVDGIDNFAARVAASNGLVRTFGTAPDYGSDAGKLPAGMTAIGLAADPATGGYRILSSAGGVDGFHAPASGSATGRIPSGAMATAIAPGPAGGYYILTSDGAVFAFPGS